MKVIYKAPGCAPEPWDIPNTLEELQATVGGYIETVTIATDVVIICNEEGRLQGLPHNCRIFGVDFVGPILIAGVDEDEFSDLDTFMAYAQMCVDDAVDDPEIVYTKEKMDRALRAACGENIRPFEERYAVENLYFREKLKEKSHE